MRIRSLTLQNWRCYKSANVSFGDGLTVIVGGNGQGKTSLIEAVGWLSGLGSFRGASDDALVHVDAPSTVLRATAGDDNGRDQLIEAEVPRSGRTRIQINRQRLSRAGDLVGVMPVTMFGPDDLALVKGGPARRRSWIDAAAATRYPRYGGLRTEMERILRQRNALLRNAGGRLVGDAGITLDVWDERLAATGSEVYRWRCRMLNELRPELTAAYEAIARLSADVCVDYMASWSGDLGEALVASRSVDVRRAMTTIGPHRDDVRFGVNGVSARTQASQGEQRSLALAMRLAVDSVLRNAGELAPILLLDDVFSELDTQRTDALLECLPAGQCLVTTASALPIGAVPDQVYRVTRGQIKPVATPR